jgi:ribonuclease E
MSRKMLIDATHAEETRVVVVDGNKVEEFDFETINKRQLAGNIYLAKVTRVEPSLQAAFVDYGGNRHGFLAFAEIHPDYYQIPVEDRKILLEEERALNRAQDEEDNSRARSRPRPAPRPAAASGGRDPVKSGRASAMDVIDLDDETAEATTMTPDQSGDAPYEHDHSHEDGAENGHDHSQLGAHSHDHSHENGGDQQGEASADGDNGERRYKAIDHASDTDDEIESIAEEDVAEEISAPRRPRARRYKIQEVVKVRQIMLVQVVKEERGNKGAALTTYLSLAGRYCVLMPNTARGGGISRKITQATDRKKLKEIAGEIEVPEGAGLIIRTAGAKRTKPEIKRDYEYLMRLWEEIRELTLKSMAPAQIYEEGNLIKRTIRDLYSKEIDEVLVEGEAGYRTAKDFMRMIMPANAKDVKRYDEAMPLFARFQVESYLGGMFNPTVQLKSGGYIVIGITEALVAVDVNSGRSTREGSIEDTALKTNLEAAEEVARQLRLRDLAGLIVIDFIDMEERRNNLAVEKRLKDKLKTDRARIQVGRISGFGLMEMSRQRLRPGMLESTTQPCSHCHGTGLIRSDDSLGLQVLRALDEEGTRKRSKEVLLKAPIGIVNFLINQKREHIALIEARYGMAVRIEADPAMISPDFAIEKFKTATRNVPEQSAVVSGNASLMGAPVAEFEEEDDLVEDDIVDEVEADEAEVSVGETGEKADGQSPGGPKKKRRRRRRKKGGSGSNGAPNGQAEGPAGDDDDEDGDDAGEDAGEDAAEVTDADSGAAEPAAEAPVKKTYTRSRTRAKAEVAAEVAPEAAPVVVAAPEVAPVEAPVKKPASRSRAKPKVVEAESVVAEPAPTEAPPEAAKPKTTRSRAPAKKPSAEAVPAEAVMAVEAEMAAPAAAPPEPPAAKAEPVPVEAAPEQPAAPRKKGWWNLGR